MCLFSFLVVTFEKYTQAASITDCIYRVKVTNLDKKDVEVEFIKLSEKLGTESCQNKNGQKLKIKRYSKVRPTINSFLRLRMLQYKNLLKNDPRPVVVNKYYFYKN